MESEVKTQEVRRSAWAGEFYPASPTELSRDIAQLYSLAPKPHVDGDVVAVLAPHAGYQYSGQIATNSFKLLEGAEFETVIIVAPSHTKYFSGISVYNGGAYETPLGVLATDVHVAKRLGRTAPGSIYLSNMGHTGGDRPEHALEVQLPLLQIVLGTFKLVAVIMGDQQIWRLLGDALAAAVTDSGSTLLVASSDLSHYHEARRALQLDGAVQRAVADFDAAALSHVINSGKGEACGAGPLLACMHAARKLGATRSLITGYAHSGQVTKDDSGVVGYLGAAFVREQEPASDGKVYTLNADSIEGGPLSEADRTELLRLARQAVVSAVHQSSPPEMGKVSKALRVRRGVFVTLKVDGQLRGCLGSVECSTPIVDQVIRMAVAAATRDPRFEPVSGSDLAHLSVEVSVLGPLERCDDRELIEIGRHGLLVRKGDFSGVLLPQVASENGWDRLMFLKQVCLKASLAAEAWRDSASSVYMFEAEVFWSGE
jgi:AmmeMemoRadiSam system protein B/AmmeMemoRadiSam system protein A